MKCAECKYFTDGRCRNPRSKRTSPGYFQEACDLFEIFWARANSIPNQDTMKENNATTATEPNVPAEALIYKECKDCGRELPLTEFQKGPHGYMNYCKECFKKRQKAGKIAEVRKALIEQDANVKDTPILNTLPNILVAARRLEDAEIIDLVSDLCDELRERGYEINGNIYRKFEI